MGVLTALLVLKQLHCASLHKQRQRLNLTAVISAAQCAHSLIKKAEGAEKQPGIFFLAFITLSWCVSQGVAHSVYSVLPASK